MAAPPAQLAPRRSSGSPGVGTMAERGGGQDADGQPPPARRPYSSYVWADRFDPILGTRRRRAGAKLTRLDLSRLDKGPTMY
jgi:hypothetical protein